MLLNNISGNHRNHVLVAGFISFVQIVLLPCFLKGNQPWDSFTARNASGRIYELDVKGYYQIIYEHEQVK